MGDLGLSAAFGGAAAGDEIKRILAEQYQRTLDAQKFALEQENQKRLGEGLQLQKDSFAANQAKSAHEADVEQFNAMQGSEAPVLGPQTPDPVTHLVSLPGVQPFAPMKIRGYAGSPDVTRTPESGQVLAERARGAALQSSFDKPYTNAPGSVTTIPSVGVIATGGEKEHKLKPEFVNISGNERRVLTDEDTGQSFDPDTKEPIPASTIKHLIPDRQPVPIVVMGPDGPVIVDRKTATSTPVTSHATGQPIGKAASPAIAQSVAGAEQGISIIDDLMSIPHDDWVGPVEGLLTVAKQHIPGVTVPDDMARFIAQSATLKNSVIKAITGAQMSEPEAKRIMQQVPTLDDKPSVWKQKAIATRENMKFLHDRMLQATGTTTLGRAPNVPVASHQTTLPTPAQLGFIKKGGE